MIELECDLDNQGARISLRVASCARDFTWTHARIRAERYYRCIAIGVNTLVYFARSPGLYCIRVQSRVISTETRDKCMHVAADTIFTTRFRKSAKRSSSAECYNHFTTNRPSEVCLRVCARSSRRCVSITGQKSSKSPKILDSSWPMRLFVIDTIRWKLNFVSLNRHEITVVISACLWEMLERLTVNCNNRYGICVRLR